jgi:hypothetical protein
MDYDHGKFNLPAILGAIALQVLPVKCNYPIFIGLLGNFLVERRIISTDGYEQ